LLTRLSVISLASAFGAIVISATVLSGAFANANSLSNILKTDSAENHDALHEASASKLPMDVRQTFKKYDKAGDANGSEIFLKINEDFIDPDNHCEFCTRIEYTPGPRGEVGLFYKSDKAIDISEAKRVVFFAKGEKGGEFLQFMAAGSGMEGRNTGEHLFNNEQTAVKTQKIQLNDDWQRYEIDLTSANDLSRVTHAFGFEAYKGLLLTDPSAIVFYVKGVQFDTDYASNPIPPQQ